jgi:hypothetical protein
MTGPLLTVLLMRNYPPPLPQIQLADETFLNGLRQT